MFICLREDRGRCPVMHGGSGFDCCVAGSVGMGLIEINKIRILISLN